MEKNKRLKFGQPVVWINKEGLILSNLIIKNSRLKGNSREETIKEYWGNRQRQTIQKGAEIPVGKC